MPGLSLKRRIGSIAVGLGFIAASCGLFGLAAGASAATPQAKPTTTTTTTTTGRSTTTFWKGNGTTNGLCGSLSEGLTGVPPGDQGWLFVLTNPDPGPWELTATFAKSGTIKVAGTQNGNGSVHFVVISSAGDKLLSASSTNGGHNLVVSGCTLGPKVGPYGPSTQPSTVTTTTTHGHAATKPATFDPHPPAAVAFTGADLALLFTIGAAAIGLGGMLVLAARRRRSQRPYGSGRR